MSEENIVPFANVAAKRAAQDNAAPDISAIENLLIALEGMQTHLQALTELVCEHDKRISKLEKAKSKIIQVSS